jgi:hypothetical protein
VSNRDGKTKNEGLFTLFRTGKLCVLRRNFAEEQRAVVDYAAFYAADGGEALCHP